MAAYISKYACKDHGPPLLAHSNRALPGAQPRGRDQLVRQDGPRRPPTLPDQALVSSPLMLLPEGVPERLVREVLLVPAGTPGPSRRRASQGHFCRAGGHLGHGPEPGGLAPGGDG